MRKLGWKKDLRDERDFLHKARGIIVALPPYVNHRGSLPVVRDQGSLGSCVGFGVGGSLTATANQRFPDVKAEWFSPTWIYNGARHLDGSLTEDAGAYPRDAYEWLKDKGCLLEHFWPYRDTLDTRIPLASLEPEAAKWPLISYYRVVDGLLGLKSALADGHIVSLGSPWFFEWTEIFGARLPAVTKDSLVVGGHETYIYGYNDSEECFYCVNSWGTDWAGGGHFELPYSAIPVFKELGGYDAYYVTVNWNEPEPEPAPEPVIPAVVWIMLAVFAAVLAILAILVF